MKFVKTLSVADKGALDELMRTSHNFRVRRRAHMIILSSKKYKIEELSNIFDVDRDTISEWLRRWESSGLSGLTDGKRTGRPKKEGEAIEE